MTRRKLGRSDLSIAPIIFGGNVFGWSADETTSFTLLDAFVDAGFNAIDTADAYSHWVPGNKGGESETIIGNWLKARGRRDDVVIFTKVGGDMGQGNTLKADYVLRAAEDSLRRLRTDYIDLYQTHFDDLTTAPDETLQAYAKLVAQGKVRVLGASNVSPDRLREFACRKPQARHCRAMRRCSRSTISMTAPASSATTRRCANRSNSASSTITRWRAASCRGNTGRSRTFPKAQRAAPAWPNISTRADCAFSMRWTWSPTGTRQRPPR